MHGQRVKSNTCLDHGHAGRVEAGPRRGAHRSLPQVAIPSGRPETQLLTASASGRNGKASGGLMSESTAGILWPGSLANVSLRAVIAAISAHVRPALVRPPRPGPPRLRAAD